MGNFKFIPETLMEQASKSTGLSSFGEAPLLEGLAILCQALNGEAQLTRVGNQSAHADLREILVQRLRVMDWYRQAPEISEERIIAPIMVVGLPRSGTSALSQLLAQDPANRSIRRWEGTAPTPPPELESESTDPRVVATKAMLDKRYADSPDLMAMNPVTVDDPTENECFLKHCFMSLHFAGIYNVPTYQEWLLNCDMRPAYRYLLEILKLLQWRRPPTRWNLKYPLDLFFLDAIADVIPDARLVWTHRDPIKTVPSVASLLAARRRPSMKNVDKLTLGRQEFEVRKLQIERGLSYRDSRDALSIVDLRNDELLKNPVTGIKKLYAELGIEFTGQFQTELERRIAERPKGKFGKHSYTAEEYGLDEKELLAAFSDYKQRFQV